MIATNFHLPLKYFDVIDSPLIENCSLVERKYFESAVISPQKDIQCHLMNFDRSDDFDISL
jgi:hypothetical protein